MDWLADGVRFECQPDCGRCCTGMRPPETAVLVSRPEQFRLAELLRLSLDEFVRRFTVPLAGDHRKALRPEADGACPFLDRQTKRCRVHSAKPRQCRLFPWWPSHLASEGDWESLKAQCPGVGEGQLVPAAEVRLRVREAADLGVGTGRAGW